MHLRAVLRTIGPVIVTIGLAMYLSAIVSLLYAESPVPLLIGGTAAIIFGILVRVLFRRARADDIQMIEGCAIATLSWVLCCAFGALPFVLMSRFGSTTSITWTQAYYEAVSGFTTTGASIFADVEVLPKGILFWRSFTHWFGGMGIVVLAVAILPKLGVGGMQAFRWEAPGPLKADKIVPRIQDTARILYTTYLGVTIAEIIALLLVGVGLFDSLVYTFGTVGTGGFGVHNASVAGLQNPAAEWIIAAFMWLSGVNFTLTYFLIVRGAVGEFLRDSEWRTYAAITAVATAAITVGIAGFNGWSVVEALRYAFFQVATIVTTTGYATYDYATWPVYAVAPLLPLMFIGGSTGSTGGGPKVLRHMISWRYIVHEMQKLARPHLVTTVKIGGRPIDASVTSSVMGFLLLYAIIFFLGGVALFALGHDMVTAFSASIANLGNIGPGFNIVGPAGNYSTFPTSSLWILIAQMLLGRLELFTLLILFLPSLWRSRPSHRR